MHLCLGRPANAKSANACSGASPRGWGETVNRNCVKQERKKVKPAIMFLAGHPPPFNDGDFQISPTSVLGHKKIEIPLSTCIRRPTRDHRHYTASSSLLIATSTLPHASRQLRRGSHLAAQHQWPIAFAIFDLGAIRTCGAMQ